MEAKKVYDLDKLPLKKNAAGIIQRAKIIGQITDKDIAGILPKNLLHRKDELLKTIRAVYDVLEVLNIALVRNNSLSAKKSEGGVEIKKASQGCGASKNPPIYYSRDIIGIYGEEISKFYVLDKEKVKELAEEYQLNGSLSARNQLIKHNLRLAFKVAGYYKDKIGARNALEFLDLVQAGSLGLITSVEKFNPSLGFEFSTYAMWNIKQAIFRTIYNQSKTIREPVHFQEDEKRVIRAMSRLYLSGGKEPDAEQLAFALSMPIGRVKEVLRQLDRKILSLDEKYDNGDKEISELYGSIESKAVPTPELSLMAKHEAKRAFQNISDILAKISACCTDKEQDMFRMRYGFIGYGAEPKTLEEIGGKYSISRERVRQIIEKIWQRLHGKGINKNHDDKWVRCELDRFYQLSELSE